MENQVIDIFKMDIEGPEKQMFESLDMSYACKYFKQMVFETHMNFKFQDLVKLEECFFLYRRDTRFFELPLPYSDKLGYLSEFQAPDGFKLDLKKYKNEIYLSEFMFVNGEFYFANENFFSL